MLNLLTINKSHLSILQCRDFISHTKIVVTVAAVRLPLENV